MIDRFLDDRGRELLIEALRAQIVVGGDRSLAAELAQAVRLREYAEGETLIAQDSADNNLHLILSGSVVIQASGRDIATRTAGQHVGEIAVLDPTAERGASVVALRPTVAGTLSERDFSAIAADNPTVWRNVALELGNRLRERDEQVRPRNARPLVFIGSSTETLSIARAIQSSFERDDILARVWTDHVFGASRFAIEDLIRQAEAADFAVFVVGPDDKLISRDSISESPRDNVVFEIGLFMGSLGRERTFVVCPRGRELRIPTDLLGISLLEYASGYPKDLPADIAPACNHLRNAINEQGPK